MLEIYPLKVFLAAAEHNSFSEAARQLHLTQPAVSMQIQALEKKLNVKLFHRSGRTLSLTDHGQALAPMARDIINRVVQIEEEIEALKGQVVGHLKIGCSTTTGKYVLPHLVARFRQRYPQVQISIYNHGQDVVMSELDNGAIQLAVVSCEPAGKEVYYCHFFTDCVVLIVPAAHPWAKRDRIALDELLKADFILRDPESGTRQELEAALQQVGSRVRDLNVVMEMGSSEAISMAVEEGIGVAFVSRVVAQRGLDLGKIREVCVAGISLRRDIFLAYSQSFPASQAQTAFWNFIQEPGNQMLLQKAA